MSLARGSCGARTSAQERRSRLEAPADARAAPLRSFVAIAAAASCDRLPSLVASVVFWLRSQEHSDE
jgi:hypothetical protein